MTEPHEATRAWVIRLIVYVMLVASALAAFLFDDWLWRTMREGHLPVWIPLVPPIMFTAFVMVYVIDRWLLVRRRNFPAIRAFFQVGIAVTFLALLWPKQATELRRERRHSRPTESSPQLLLTYKDPVVRAAGCELVLHRGDTALLAEIERLAQGDSSPQVRSACRSAAADLRARRAAE